jgi:hypothetical protein
MKLFPDKSPVDPSQYLVPWESVTEALLVVVVLSMTVERVLAVVFESERYILYQEIRAEDDKANNKAFIASVVSILVCYIYQIDILAVVTSEPYVSFFGVVMTGLLIAGGSKGSIALFRDFLGIKSTARKDYENRAKPPKKPRNPPTNDGGDRPGDQAQEDGKGEDK